MDWGVAADGGGSPQLAGGAAAAGRRGGGPRFNKSLANWLVLRGQGAGAEEAGSAGASRW